jgi:chromosome segregation ATPase
MNTLKRCGTIMLSAVVALGLGACAASAERPDAQLARAQTSIDLAEESGAREFGAAALEQARYHLAQAQQAAEQGHYQQAERLAHESELDAELAAAQTDRQEAERALEEINASIQTLRREIARKELDEGEQS